MADYNDIKQSIATNLPDNNRREITAAKLRSTLNEFVNKVETTETGIEGNVSDINTKITGLGKEGIYDVTANNDGATFASLSALLSSVNLSTLIPVEVRGGGMSIRFVRSSDNKYVQYRLTNQNWSIDVNDWTGGESEPTSVESEFATGEKVSKIGIDDKPTAGSNNLVKSGGVYNENKLKLVNLFNNLFTIQGYIIRSNGLFSSVSDGSYYCTDYLEIDKPSTIKFKGFSNAFIAPIAFYDENKEYIGSTITATGYNDYIVSSEDMQSLETTTGKFIKYVRFTTDTNKGYIYEGLTIAPLFRDIKNKVNSADFASEINKLNGNIFVRRGYYIQRSGKKVTSTGDNSYAVSPIIPIDRKNNIDYYGINNNSIGAILFLDENFESIFVSPLALTPKFVLTPSQIDTYEQDTALNPDGKTIRYFIACANLTNTPNAYCYNISINSVNTFVNAIKSNVDSLVNNINTSVKFKGVITDYTTRFQTIDSGFYRLSANTANTFADLPDKEKTGSPGARDWELIVFKIDYGAIYLLKRVQRNVGFPEYYLGYIYYGMSSIEWQVIRTDFSLKNHNEEMIFTGDSIMVRLMGEKEYLESLTNYTIINKAISGSCMALRTDSLAEEWNPKSMVYRTNPNNSGSENFIDVSNARKIFIWMGVNDRTAGNPLGADDSTSEHEIMGAMRKIVENLLTQNPYISICFATPNANPNRSSNSPTLEDYANRIISGCEILNVECLDIFHQSCITETNKDIAFTDGLHPKAEWLHNVAANKFKERM